MKPIPPKTYLKVFLRLSATIVIFYFIFWLASGTTTSSITQNINYSEVYSGTPPEQAIASLPNVRIVEFGIDTKSVGLFTLLSKLPILQGHFDSFAPKFESSTRNDQFILDINLKNGFTSRLISSCEAVTGSDLIFINTWHDDIRLINDYPQKFTYGRYLSGKDREINIVINRIDNDGVLDVVFNDTPLLLQSDQEYRTTTIQRSLTDKYTETWYLRNMPNAKVLCTPKPANRDL